jgi:hypothetical protein
MLRDIRRPDPVAIAGATIEVRHRPPLRSISPALKREPPGRFSLSEKENASGWRELD